jgi:hypothetical protein
LFSSHPNHKTHDKPLDARYHSQLFQQVVNWLEMKRDFHFGTAGSGEVLYIAQPYLSAYHFKYVSANSMHALARQTNRQFLDQESV